MNESQRRAFSALGIGPLWLPRTQPMQPGAAESVDGDAPSLFVLSDEAGGWLFVGEAEHADPATDPICDAAARSADPMRLLERMIVALGLRPAEVVHVPCVDGCRWQADDDAAADADGALAERIDAIAPRVVFALGDRAARALLRTDAPLAELRGRVHEAATGSSRVPVVVSWHPSQLLAAPREKAGAWADLCLAREVAGGGS